MGRAIWYAALVLLIAMISIAVYAVPVLAAEPSISIVLNPAKDGVALTVHASYASRAETSSPGLLALTLNTQYFEQEKTLNTRFAVKLDIPVTTATPSTEFKEIHLYLGGVFSSRNGSGTVIIKGELRTENGTATFFADMRSSYGEDLRGDLRVRALITAEKQLVSPDLLRQLSLIELMLSPQLVNAQLAKQNVTWIRFTELRIVHEEKAETIVFKVNASMEIDYSAMFKQLKLANLSTVRELLELQRSIEQRGEFGLQLDAKPARITMGAKLSSTMRGDIEKLMRLQSRYFAEVYTASAPPEVLEELRPWLELVVLPWNTTFEMVVSSRSGEAKVNIMLKNLRIGHAYLRGEEAQKRVADLLLTLLEAAKTSGLSIEYVNKVPDSKPIQELLPTARKVLQAAIQGEIGPKYIRKIPFVPPPPPAATRTTAITLTITMPPKTSVPSLTLSVITKLVPSTTTVVKSVIVTYISTLLKTVTQTLTKTMLYTVTQSTTLIVTTTKVEMSTAPLVAGLVIAAIGIGVAVLMKRRL